MLKRACFDEVAGEIVRTFLLLLKARPDDLLSLFSLQRAVGSEVVYFVDTKY